jgi:uncharacterized membrane protein YagU involved in acid resistance
VTARRSGAGKRALRGAVAGALATGLMSSVMVGAKRAGFLGDMPPEKITAAMLHRAEIGHTGAQQDALATLLHFGFGATAGAAFGVIAPRPLIVRVPAGLAYGAAIWGVSYMGWVPALGIMPSAEHDRRDRQTVMLAAHLIYGTALAVMVGTRTRNAANDQEDATPA